MYPRVYLALDNCFASKRWTEPSEWMQIAQTAGVYFIEASADNECDPLYTPPDTLQTWLDNVRVASEQTGVRVANLYSGHGSYATLALGHPDPRVRDHIQHHWLEPMIRNAAALGAGLGFFCHAFPQSVLQTPERYAQAESDLYGRLSELAAFAAEIGLRGLSVEQMYSPHQIPWTIDGALRLLRAVFQRAKKPLCITLDTGHQTGQRSFQRPEREQIEAYVAAICRGRPAPDIWLGGNGWDALTEADGVETILAHIQARPYLFAAPEDGDLYAWLRRLGCYSPIVHLQQTDGSESKHRPFTASYNRKGIVSPPKVLAALLESYQAASDEIGYPPPCREIYLTLELFSGTADWPAHILSNINRSVAYWRQFIPEDGLPLDQLVKQSRIDDGSFG